MPTQERAVIISRRVVTLGAVTQGHLSSLSTLGVSWGTQMGTAQVCRGCLGVTWGLSSTQGDLAELTASVKDSGC